MSIEDLDYLGYYPKEYTPLWYEGIHITNDFKEIRLDKLELSHLKNLIKWGKNKGYNTYHLELELRIRNLKLNK